MVKYIASLIVLLTIIGCPEAPQPRVPPQHNKQMATTSFIDTGTGLGIIRFIDEEVGAVCYARYGSGGVFCIPIQYTNLKEGK